MNNTLYNDSLQDWDIFFNYKFMQVNVYGLALTSPRRGKEVLSLVGGETGPQEEGILLSQVI